MGTTSQGCEGRGRGRAPRERDALADARAWYCGDLEVQHTEPCYVAHTPSAPYVMPNGAHVARSGAYIAWARHAPHAGACGTGARVLYVRESSRVRIAEGMWVERDTPRGVAQHVEACADCRARGHVACDHVEGTGATPVPRPLRVRYVWAYGERGERVVPRVWASDPTADVQRARARDAVPAGYAPHVCPRTSRTRDDDAPDAPQHDATRTAERCACADCVAFLNTQTPAQRRARARYVAQRAERDAQRDAERVARRNAPSAYERARRALRAA